MNKLLIIDDEWMVRRFIADVATSQGIDVVATAESWDEAAKALSSQAIDFAIVDIEVKGSMDGIGIARKLKEKNIPFLFMTAYKDINTIKEATELMPISYLIKPVTSENLIAALLIATQKADCIAPKNESYRIGKDGLVYKDSDVLELSKNERIVFSLLIQNRGHVVGYATIFGALWENPDEINEGSLRNIIVKLRKKIPDIKIDNIKDMGYKLF